jgi:hypothetical protein
MRSKQSSDNNNQEGTTLPTATTDVPSPLKNRKEEEVYKVLTESGSQQRQVREYKEHTDKDPSNRKRMTTNVSGALPHLETFLIMRQIFMQFKLSVLQICNYFKSSKYS